MMSHSKIPTYRIKQGCSLVLLSLCLACNGSSVSDEAIMKVSDEWATASTNHLYASLWELTKKGIMLGHQDDLMFHNVSGESSNDSNIKLICGDYPAVFGWDLGSIETNSAFNGDSIDFESIKQNIRKAHQLGGIVTLSWQVSNPAKSNQTSDCTRYSAIESVLPKHPNHALYLTYLDRLADFFSDLKDENGMAIPVIFRPFHSANDLKYWWNTEQNTPEQYKQLWAMTVDYLRTNKKVNQLIYAYSAFNVKNLDEFLRYYPGNDYVDIVGSEVYFSLENDPDGDIFKHDLERNLLVITTFSRNNHKIPSITEIGLEGIKVFNFFSEYVYPIVTKYPVSYMLFWKNARNNHSQYFIPIPGHPACDDFVSFVNRPNILTCREI
ncbi:MAG: glycoside hydrolase family 26 protein [Candidatus Symbiothrix sp.]|jgi:hypothetical protein|nr:glycoside hydrolase family 26 protein [Candidatus Symbiothrix sp.]